MYVIELELAFGVQVIWVVFDFVLPRRGMKVARVAPWHCDIMILSLDS